MGTKSNINKSEQAADAILSYIIANRLRPGDKLPPESELAEKFGVSRVSVREGLRGLKFLGLAVSLPRRGTVLGEVNFPLLSRFLGFQIAISDFSYRQLFEARFSLELGVLHQLCGRLSAAQQAELRELAPSPDAAPGGDPESDAARVWAADAAFHRALFRFSGNPVLLAFARILDIFFSRIIPRPRAANCDTGAEHLLLADALSAGNIDLARGILLRHLDRYQKLIPNERKKICPSK